MHSVGEEDDIEDIPREVFGPESTAGFSHGQSQSTLPPMQEPGTDVTLFIKMSLHPTTLSNYLFPVEPVPGIQPDLTRMTHMRHCFHEDTSIGILLALLDGVEYLHSQSIIHRDLKPANIFLSVHYDKPPALNGCIEITACSRCADNHNSPSNGKGKAKSPGEERRKVYITPCIGDFGLIAKVESGVVETPLASLHSKPVGTRLYRPDSLPKTEPVICPKLDVYSLSVIALELLYKFGTASERNIVLNRFKNGTLPPDFETDEIAEGIMAMSMENRDDRWGTSEVRAWLQELQVKE
jgi:translation initiation factor 2-alpha kinase 3